MFWELNFQVQGHGTIVEGLEMLEMVQGWDREERNQWIEDNIEGVYVNDEEFSPSIAVTVAQWLLSMGDYSHLDETEMQIALDYMSHQGIGVGDVDNAMEDCFTRENAFQFTLDESSDESAEEQLARYYVQHGFLDEAINCLTMHDAQDWFKLDYQYLGEVLFMSSTTLGNGHFLTQRGNVFRNL